MGPEMITSKFYCKLLRNNTISTQTLSKKTEEKETLQKAILILPKPKALQAKKTTGNVSLPTDVKSPKESKP